MSTKINELARVFYDPDYAEKDELAGKLAEKGDDEYVHMGPSRIGPDFLTGRRYAVRKSSVKNAWLNTDADSGDSDDFELENNSYMEFEGDDDVEDSNLEKTENEEVKESNHSFKDEYGTDDPYGEKTAGKPENVSMSKFNSKNDSDSESAEEIPLYQPEHTSSIGDPDIYEEADKDLELNADEDYTKYSSLDQKVGKGLMVLDQLQSYDSLMEVRISFHKILSQINQFPMPIVWPHFDDVGGEEWKHASRDVSSRLHMLMDKLLKLQCELSLQQPTTNYQVADSTKTTIHPPEIDENIPSDDSGEDEKQDTSIKQRRFWRTKRSFDQYELLLKKSYSCFVNYQHETVQLWDDQTSFGPGSSKKFQAFHQPVIKQIQQIISDKERLIKRSQQKRIIHRVLGTVEEDNLKDSYKMPNIYDDNDFYQHMLYDLIERKASSDPILQSKQWAAIQNMRNKLKRKLDTKASKGRKLRYTTIDKLVSFMAPSNRADPQWTEEAMDNLFSSVGDQRHQAEIGIAVASLGETTLKADSS